MNDIPTQLADQIRTDITLELASASQYTNVLRTVQPKFCPRRVSMDVALSI